MKRDITQKRRDKINYYLDLAEVVAERSTCIRKQYGCIIVKNDEVKSTGYNGAPRGCANCIDLNVCIRDELNIPRGERYEACRAIHSESNATSCKMCKRIIINAGIKQVIVRDTKDTYRIIDVQSWIDNNLLNDNILGY